MFKRLREGLFGRTDTEREQQPALPEVPPEAPSDAEAPEASQAESAHVETGSSATEQPVASQPAAPAIPAPPQRTTPAGSLRGPFAPPVAPLPQTSSAERAAATVVERPPATAAATSIPAAAPTMDPGNGAGSTAAVESATATPNAPPAPAAAPSMRPTQPARPAQPAPAAQAATAMPAAQPVSAPPTAAPTAPPIQTPRAQPARPASPVPAAPTTPPRAAAPAVSPQPAAKPKPVAQQAPAITPAEEDKEERGGRSLNPFRRSLGKTRALFGRMNLALEADEEISDELWDELEETLITSDVGVQTTEQLLATLREHVRAEGLTRGSQLREALKEELAIMLGDVEPLVFSQTSPISVFLVVGVNGVGKTTTIAKMANQLKKERRRVMLAAADTFRAAATEQLKTWGERVGVPVIAHQHGADPGAVVYDAMQAAQARTADVLIVDTAGRLHTKYNLMEELKKIVKVLQKYDAEAPHEVLLVIDATTGQNGFLQAKQFVKDAGVSGVILTKLDGTARGGIVFAIAAELGLPIKYVGTGERVSDLAPFDPDAFVDALFDDGER